MKFKTEISLLLMAIIMFLVSAYFYLYQTGPLALSESLGIIPSRFYAFSLVGIGSVLTVVASVSFTRRSKECLQ